MIIPKLREKSIVDFLTIGFVTGDESIFEGIKRITAGEYLSCSFDNVEKENIGSHNIQISFTIPRKWFTPLKNAHVVQLIFVQIQLLR